MAVVSAIGMLRIVWADRRRLLWPWLLGGPGVAIIILLTTADLDASLEESDSLRSLWAARQLLALYLGQMPLMIWASKHPYGKASRMPLLETLPLSVRELNLARLGTGLVLLIAGMITWTVTCAVFNHVGEPIPPWTLLSALSFFATYVFLCMRHPLARALPHVLALVLLFQVLGKLLLLPTEHVHEPWVGLVMTVAAVTTGWIAIRRPPPTWARR
jgi:hypothetical protein